MCKSNIKAYHSRLKRETKKKNKTAHYFYFEAEIVDVSRVDLTFLGSPQFQIL